MKQLLEKLFQNYRLSEQEAYEMIQAIAKDEVNEHQLTAFITVFNLRNIGLEEISGFKKALLERAVPVNLPKESIDIVGTGGDGKDTFNISTLSAFVVAAMDFPVVKHGSYSASSVSGSSDMLAHFGYHFTSDETILVRFLEQTGICFLHAPILHPVMKKVAPIRKNLQVKTFFNLLGPLVNPVQPNHQLLGTYNPEVARLYAYLAETEKRNLGVVTSIDGYDEVSLTADTLYYGLTGKKKLTPEDFGLPKFSAKSIQGGTTKKENAQIFLRILEGKGTAEQTAVVCANAGLAWHLVHGQTSLIDSVLLAKEVLENKKAYAVFTQLMNLSNEYS